MERSLRISLDANVSAGAQKYAQAMRDITNSNSALIKSSGDVRAMMQLVSEAINLLTNDAKTGERAIKEAEDNFRKVAALKNDLDTTKRAVSEGEKNHAETAFTVAKRELDLLKERQAGLTGILNTYKEMREAFRKIVEGGVPKEGIAVKEAPMTYAQATVRGTVGREQGSEYTIQHFREVQKVISALTKSIEEQQAAEAALAATQKKTAEATTAVTNAEVARKEAVVNSTENSRYAQIFLAKAIASATPVAVSNKDWAAFERAITTLKEKLGPLDTEAKRVFGTLIEYMQKSVTASGELSKASVPASVLKTAEQLTGLVPKGLAEKYQQIFDTIKAGAVSFGPISKGISEIEEAEKKLEATETKRAERKAARDKKLQDEEERANAFARALAQRASATEAAVNADAKLSQSTREAALAANLLDKGAAKAAEQIMNKARTIQYTTEGYNKYIAALRATAIALGEDTREGQILLEVMRSIQAQAKTNGGLTIFPVAPKVTQVVKGAAGATYGTQASQVTDTLNDIQALTRASAALGSAFGGVGEESKKNWLALTPVEKLLRSLQTATGGLTLGLLGVQTQLGLVSAAGHIMQRSLASVSFAIGSMFSFREAIKQIGDFDQSLRTIQAAGGITGEALSRLESDLRRVGTSSQFSANQAAEAYLVLVRAGYDAAQANEALVPTLKFVTAGQLGIAQASEITSKVLKQFNLDVSDTTRVTNVLLTVANKSTTDVRNLGEALKFVGPIAAEAGMSVEETTAILGTLASRGIDASMAGTVLRNIITQLIDPSTRAIKVLSELGLTTKDMKVGADGLTGVLKKLGETEAGLEQIANLAQKRSIAGLAVLSQNTDEVLRLEEATKKSKDAASDQADIIGGSLPISMAKARAATAELLLSAGDHGLKGTLQAVTDGFTIAIRQVSGFTGSMGPMSAGAYTAAAAIKTLATSTAIYMALRLGSSILQYASGFRHLAETADMARERMTWWGKANLWILGASVAISAVIAAWKLLTAESEESIKAREKEKEVLQKVTEHLESAGNAAKEYNRISLERKTEVSFLKDANKELEAQLKLTKELNTARKLSVATTPPAPTAASQRTATATELLELRERQRALEPYREEGRMQRGEFVSTFRAQEYKVVTERLNTIEESIRKLGIEEQQRVEKTGRQIAAQRAVNQAISDYAHNLDYARSKLVTLEQVGDAGEYGGPAIKRIIAAQKILESLQYKMGLGGNVLSDLPVNNQLQVTGEDIEKARPVLIFYQKLLAGINAEREKAIQQNNRMYTASAGLKEAYDALLIPMREELALSSKDSATREALILKQKLVAELKQRGLPTSVEEIRLKVQDEALQKRLIAVYEETFKKIEQESLAISRNKEVQKARTEALREQHEALKKLQDLTTKASQGAARQNDLKAEDEVQKQLQTFDEYAREAHMATFSAQGFNDALKEGLPGIISYIGAVGATGTVLSFVRERFRLNIVAIEEHKRKLKEDQKAEEERAAAARKYENIRTDLINQRNEIREVHQTASDYGLDLHKAQQQVRLVAEARQALESMYSNMADGDAKDTIIKNKIKEILRLNMELQKEIHTEQLAEEFGSAWGKAFEAFVEGTKTAKDAAKDLLKELQHMVLQEALTTPVKNMARELFMSAYQYFGGWGRGGAGYGEAGGPAGPPSSAIGPSAYGNTFMNGTIVPFARGGLLGGVPGIITQPTTFQMASGQYARAGETMTEAIFPLTRNAQGQLGIRASGAPGGEASVVNRHFHANINVKANNPDEFKGSRRQLLAEITSIGQRALR